MPSIPLPLMFTVAMAASATASLPTPAGFALADLEGQWHVQGHIPYLLERNRVAPTLRYTRRDDGKFDEFYTAQKGGFDAERKTFRSTTWAPDAARPWDLKTRLFVVVTARYSVLELDRARGLALLGTEDRDKAWVLSRAPAIDDATWRELHERLAAHGFERTRVLRIAQVPADLGKPGYAPVDD